MSVAEVVPVSIPGLRVVRWTTDQLRVGMKEHHAVGRTERGHSKWWAQGKVWNSGPGSIQLKQPGDVHRDVAHDGPVTFQVVLLPARDLEMLSDDGKVVAHPHLAAGDERARPFHRLCDAITARVERLALEVVLAEAVEAFANLRTAAPDHTRPVKRAMEYLRDRLGDATTLEDLALYAGLDKFRLCRAFRAQIGMPPHAYLTHLRIARAKELLEGGVRAAEVASRVGLYDKASSTATSDASSEPRRGAGQSSPRRSRRAADAAC